MIKRSTLYTGLIMTMMLISFQALTYNSGPPAGSTGSPKSNGNTCAQSGCHLNGPSVTTQSIVISHDIPASGFQPDTDYNITITAISGSATSNKIGFQASVESSNDFAGTLSTAQNSELLKAGNFLGHSFSGASASGGEKTWEFVWNSGDAPDGSVIYVACNFSNSNGNSTGDVIATESLTLNKDESVSIVENKMLKFSVTPNPASETIFIEGLSSEVTSIEILSLDGKPVRTYNISFDGKPENNWSADISDLAAGNYIIVPQGALYSPKQFIIGR